MLLDDIDRIEVIRGPGGATWGANAVNGVINIVTQIGRRHAGRRGQRAWHVRWRAVPPLRRVARRRRVSTCIRSGPATASRRSMRRRRPTTDWQRQRTAFASTGPNDRDAVMSKGRRRWQSLRGLCMHPPGPVPPCQAPSTIGRTRTGTTSSPAGRAAATTAVAAGAIAPSASGTTQDTDQPQPDHLRPRRAVSHRARRPHDVVVGPAIGSSTNTSDSGFAFSIRPTMSSTASSTCSRRTRSPSARSTTSGR